MANTNLPDDIPAAGTILHQAIDTIPTSAIENNRRKTLHNKIDAIERQIKNDNERAAAKKLQNDLRKSIKRWVASDYTLESPEQYTREQVLEVVDNHIERLD